MVLHCILLQHFPILMYYTRIKLNIVYVVQGNWWLKLGKVCGLQNILSSLKS